MEQNLSFSLHRFLLWVILVAVALLHVPEDSDATCLSRMFPHFNAKWKEYVIYFYKSRLIDSDRFVPDVSLRPRVFSIAIALPPKQRIKTFQDMVDFHYKILYEQPYHSLSVDEAHGNEFKSYGLSVKDLFKVSYTFIGERKVQMMMEDNERLATYAESSMSKFVKFQVSNIMAKENHGTGASFTCFIIQQTFSKRINFWYPKTENQYWLKGTVKQLVTSGLYAKWDEWALWQARLQEKLLDESVKTEGPDVVVVTKILALVTSFSVLIGIAVVVFFVEIDVNIMKIPET